MADFLNRNYNNCCNNAIGDYYPAEATRGVLTEHGLKNVAKVYTKHKADLIRLMNKYGAGITKMTSHSDVIWDLKYLIDNNLEFCKDLDALMVSEGIIKSDMHWNNQIGEAIATAVGPIVGGITGAISAKTEQKTEEDRFFHDYLLNEQKKNDSGKILIITGMTFATIGLFLFLILKKGKKNG